MLKPCAICGKEVDLLPWEEHCYTCRINEHFARIKREILSGEETSTYGEDEIICPWCGEIQDMTDDCDVMYEDGTHEDIECSDCGKKFTVTTNISYSYDTDREE